MGFFTIPTLARRPYGILSLVLNIIPGGLGSIVAGIKGKSGGTVLVGVLQIPLIIAPAMLAPAWTAVAWVWSLVWGILIFRKST